jgi:DNA-directed RNA polymerase subunit N (RpoN/RPB10)
MVPDYSIIKKCPKCDIVDKYPLTKKQYEDLFEKDKHISVQCYHCGKMIPVKFKNEVAREKRLEKNKQYLEYFTVDNKKIRVKKSNIPILE